MKFLKRTCALLLAGAIVIGGAEIGEQYAIPGAHSFIPTAAARVGRPLTPVSVAGVARRSVRRCAVGVYYC
jgi:serine acetyltransferase